jgi:hypothetical protein
MALLEQSQHLVSEEFHAKSFYLLGKATVVNPGGGGCLDEKFKTKADF